MPAENKITVARIEKRLAVNKAAQPVHWGAADQSAVLVTLLEEEGDLHFLFTRRTESLSMHRGQVSFPGGRAEAGDLTPRDTALRETREEIGVDATAIRVLGFLNGQKTFYGLTIIPVVGYLNWPVQLSISAGEVSRAFSIPLAWFLDVENREINPHQDEQGLSHQVLYYRAYQGEVVWGITAAIVDKFLEILK